MGVKVGQVWINSIIVQYTYLNKKYAHFLIEFYFGL